ncbi:MAG: hypothetical protein K2X73_00860 [Sphingomonas sp.]|uniref:hypothetical protein n=1 Tax=Sphingomonas sp. TaxID=28214 RepID=UPI0025EF7F85|nr:hypothetical protein [Sphingomonas sp.]MBX9880500.1 hypothetical protein [Sphingomonas sp.]
MTDPAPRLFADDAAVTRIGEGLLDRTLPKPEWTHEAHLGACLYLLRDRPDIDVDGRIVVIISGYNVAVGGVNDDSQGYHDTITRVFVHGVRLFLRDRAAGEGLAEAVNALLLSPIGGRRWPLDFYSAARLFSVPARRAFVPPDLAPLPML